MAEESAKLRIPYIAAAQAQKHVTHNEAMTLLDTLVQLSVLDKDLTTPPGSPAEGDCYIVAGGGGTATGAWIGWEQHVARYIDGAWRSYLPGQGNGAGWLAWVQDEDAMYRFDGAAWTLAGIEGPTGPQGVPGTDGAPGVDGTDGQSFQPNAVVNAIAGRATHDAAAAAFSVLVVSDSTNANQPTLYFKLSAANADWSAGITWLPEDGGSPSVRAATTADIFIGTALNAGDTIDGVMLAAGDLVLVKDQAAPAQNGVYVVGASPMRAPAFATYDQHAGAVVTVQEGTENGDLSFQCISDTGGTLDTDPIDFLDLWTALTPAGEITENYDTVAQPGWINLDGGTIVNGALDNPRCAARYPWMVAGNDLILPDRRGKFDRVWNNGAGIDPDAASRTARAGDGATGDLPGTAQGDGAPNATGTLAYNAAVGAASGVFGYGSNNISGSISGSNNRFVDFDLSRASPKFGAASEVRGVNHYVCKQMRLG